MLKYEPQSNEVQLVVERSYKAGEPITAWFGPQPNQRTFLNYGIVDENNPHDKLALEVDPSDTIKTLGTKLRQLFHHHEADHGHHAKLTGSSLQFGADPNARGFCFGLLRQGIALHRFKYLASPNQHQATMHSTIPVFLPFTLKTVSASKLNLWVSDTMLASVMNDGGSS